MIEKHNAQPEISSLPSREAIIEPLTTARNAIQETMTGRTSLLQLASKSIESAIRSLAVQPPMRDWLEDAAHENGNYDCQCIKCGRTFTGHKRRVTCKVCAAQPRETWQPIETAPKDETILTIRAVWWEPQNGNHRWVFTSMRETKFDPAKNRFDVGMEAPPTHWMPKPAMPALAQPRSNSVEDGAGRNSIQIESSSDTETANAKSSIE